jgi:hypothetical protein
MSDMTVANEILRQLGGNRFKALVGAKNFVGGDNMLMFQVGTGAKNKINKVRITLTPADLYNIEFFYIRGVNVKIIAKHEGIYNDMLADIFTKETGFYTTFR